MRHHLQDLYPAHLANKVKFYIGDVRDRQSIDIAMRGGVDFIFSAAALKQVPSCEFFLICKRSEEQSIRDFSS